MKTISQIANELNISKQAVYKKVNNQLKAELQHHIFKAENTTIIDDEGVDIIKKSLTSISSAQDNQQPTMSEPSDNHKNIDIIGFLQEQIRIKDNQIGNQQTTIDSLIEKIGNMQVLLKQEQTRNLGDASPESTSITQELEPISSTELTQELTASIFVTPSPEPQVHQQEPTHTTHEIQTPMSFWKNLTKFFKN